MNANEGNWVHAIRGPITLITLGALFVLNNFTIYGFDKTWPVLLIVFGLLSLLKRSMTPPPAPPQFPPPQQFPPTYNYPPPPPAGGSYSGSTYAQPVPAKGGFGGTAPPRASEPGQNPPTTPTGDTV